MDSIILNSLSYGMYAIGVVGNNRPTASIVNSVFQVTAEPKIIAVSVNHDNYTNERIKETGMFSISVLSEDTSGTVIGALGFSSGRNADKLENIGYKMLREGQPVLTENICCWCLCKVVNSIETMTHTVFLAEIKAGSEKVVGKPMTYDYYRKVIKGKSPKNAPTYKSDEVLQRDDDNLTYICPICGYVYEDEHKDFDTLNDCWSCPLCNAPKSVFQING